MWPAYHDALDEARGRRRVRRRAEQTIVLRLETLDNGDYRVTGRLHGRPLTSYCVSRTEAENERRFMRAKGYRGVRIVDHNRLRVKAKKVH